MVSFIAIPPHNQPSKFILHFLLDKKWLSSPWLVLHCLSWVLCILAVLTLVHTRYRECRKLEKRWQLRHQRCRQTMTPTAGSLLPSSEIYQTLSIWIAIPCGYQHFGRTYHLLLHIYTNVIFFWNIGNQLQDYVVSWCRSSQFTAVKTSNLNLNFCHALVGLSPSCSVFPC